MASKNHPKTGICEIYGMIKKLVCLSLDTKFRSFHVFFLRLFLYATGIVDFSLSPMVGWFVLVFRSSSGTGMRQDCIRPVHVARDVYEMDWACMKGV